MDVLPISGINQQIQGDKAFRIKPDLIVIHPNYSSVSSFIGDTSLITFLGYHLDYLAIFQFHKSHFSHWVCSHSYDLVMTYSVTYTMKTRAMLAGDACVYVFAFSQGGVYVFWKNRVPVPLQSCHSKHSVSRCLTDFNLGRKDIVEEKLSRWAVCNVILLKSRLVVSFLGSPLVCLWVWNWKF